MTAWVAIKSFDDDGGGPHTATVTKIVYDGAQFGANPYADFDGSNALTMRYLYGPKVDMIFARRNYSSFGMAKSSSGEVLRETIDKEMMPIFTWPITDYAA